MNSKKSTLAKISAADNIGLFKINLRYVIIIDTLLNGEKEVRLLKRLL